MENKRAGDMIQKELLEYALTLQPDIIGVGEMKSEEAVRTGYGVHLTFRQREFKESNQKDSYGYPFLYKNKAMEGEDDRS